MRRAPQDGQKPRRGRPTPVNGRVFPVKNRRAPLVATEHPLAHANAGSTTARQLSEAPPSFGSEQPVLIGDAIGFELPCFAFRFFLHFGLDLLDLGTYVFPHLQTVPIL